MASLKITTIYHYTEQLSVPLLIRHAYEILQCSVLLNCKTCRQHLVSRGIFVVVADYTMWQHLSE